MAGFLLLVVKAGSSPAKPCARNGAGGRRTCLSHPGLAFFTTTPSVEGLSFDKAGSTKGTEASSLRSSIIIHGPSDPRLIIQFAMKKSSRGDDRLAGAKVLFRDSGAKMPDEAHAQPNSSNDEAIATALVSEMNGGSSRPKRARTQKMVVEGGVMPTGSKRWTYLRCILRIRAA